MYEINFDPVEISNLCLYLKITLISFWTFFIT